MNFNIDATARIVVAAFFAAIYVLVYKLEGELASRAFLVYLGVWLAFKIMSRMGGNDITQQQLMYVAAANAKLKEESTESKKPNPIGFLWDGK